MKKPYVRIDFINCELEYSYNICPWSMVEDQIQAAQSSFEDITKESFKEIKPEIKLSVVWLTDKQWQKEFESWG